MSIPSLTGNPAPLVGRERELGLLHGHLIGALAGQGRLVLIGGEAGIGKTALAAELCREAVGQGALVLAGRCFDLTDTPPYGPWVELFAHYEAGPDLPALPDAFAQRGTIGHVASQAALFQAVAAFVTALTPHHPLVLVLDDLHWADPASLDLLRLLARILPDQPSLVLGLYRVDELTRRHPLSALLPLLVRESAADRLDLRHLTDDAVRALVASRYGLPRADETRLVTYLQSRAEGNALFVGELLRSLEEQEALRPERDGWQFRDTSHIRVPPLLKQVIGGRVARLGEDAQHLLGVAAVIGHEVPLETWATVGAVDEDALSVVVERAVETHIMSETQDGTRARFAHALVRETLYEDILPSRRRRLHRQVAEQLAQLVAPDFDALAYHFQQAGDARAERWLVVAGVRAQYASAMLTASQRYETAFHLLEARGGHAAEQGWLLYHLGRMLRFHDPQRSLHYTDEALRLATAVDDPALTAWLTRQHGLYRCLVGQMRAGLEEMLRGEALGREIPVEERPWLRGIASPPTLSGDVGFRVLSSHVGGTPVMWLMDAGRLAEACRYGEEILSPDAASVIRRRSRMSFPYAATADTLYGLAGAYAMLGRPAEAREALHEASRRFMHANERIQLMVYLTLVRQLRLVLVPYETEQVAERQRVMAESERAWTLALESRPDLPDAVLRYPIFPVEAQWPLAKEVIRTVPGNDALTKSVRSKLGQLAYWQGDDEVTRAILAEQLPDGPVTEPGDCLFMDATELQLLGAALALAEGDFQTARAWLAAHDRWISWSGAVLGVVEGHLAWAGYYRMAGDAAQASAHAERALVHATSPRQPMALIAAHRVFGELATDAGRFDDAIVHLDASLLLTDACASPYERALTLLGRAALLTVTGEHTGAKALLDEIRATLRPLRARPALTRTATLAARLAPQLSTAPAYPAGLSAREVEVLRLLTQGMSNGAIAAQLFVSVRTVERHVRNLYTKVGAHNRADATAFAFRHELT